MPRRFAPAVFLALMMGMGCRSGPEPETVTLYAATSTRDAVEQLAADFQKETGIAVQLNIGPSSELARQIEHGGQADLFLSADEAWADYLAERNLVEQRQDLLTNALVVIVPADSTLAISQLKDVTDPGVKRLALTAPQTPAGRYARQSLEKAGIWEQVQGRVLDGADVRMTLRYVAQGEAEAGLVYATDVGTTSKVRVAARVPADLHQPVRYPLVLVRREPMRPARRRLVEFLSSPKAGEVFRRLGFGLAGNES